MKESRGVQKPCCRAGPHHTERRTASVWPLTQESRLHHHGPAVNKLRRSDEPLHHQSDEPPHHQSDETSHLGKDRFRPILALLCGGGGARRFQSDEPLHHRSDETSHLGLFGPFSSSVL